MKALRTLFQPVLMTMLLMLSASLAAAFEPQPVVADFAEPATLTANVDLDLQVTSDLECVDTSQADSPTEFLLTATDKGGTALSELKHYQCHKQVHARPMTAGEFGIHKHGLHPGDIRSKDTSPGYLVVYNKNTADEYESWSPQHVFEQGYSEIPV